MCRCPCPASVCLPLRAGAGRGTVPHRRQATPWRLKRKVSPAARLRRSAGFPARGLIPLLPDGLFSTDPDEALAAVREESRSQDAVRSAGRAGMPRLPDAVRLLSTLLGLLLISLPAGASQCRRRRTGWRTDGLYHPARRRGGAGRSTVGVAQTVTTFLSQLNRLCCPVCSPVMGTLYVLGGNLTQATVGEGLMLVFLNVAEYLCADVTPAVCGICLSLSLLSALGLRYRMEAIGRWVRKAYTGFLGTITFLLSTLLGCGRSVRTCGLASHEGHQVCRRQSAPGRRQCGVRFAGLRGGGVDLLRSICGVCGVLLLGLLLLPVLVELLLFGLSSAWRRSRRPHWTVPPMRVCWTM